MTRPSANQNVNAVKRFFTTQFRDAGLATPDLDARLLLMAAAGYSHSELIMRGNEQFEENALTTMTNYVERRLTGEPVDHILGYREFYGRDFKISSEVLSPRPETEMLVEAALKILKDKTKPRILDLGTGSGAIIVSVLAEVDHAEGVAVDFSEKALVIAQENAQMHSVNDRLSFRQGSWFDPVAGHFDIILSNPPYITDKAMEELDTEVVQFDPDLALRGGEDGLTAYRDIIAGAKKHLAVDGVLLFEIGYDQGASVSKFLMEQGFMDVSVHTDLSGHDRMIKAVSKA